MAMSGQYSRSLLGASDEIKDIYCEPCGKDGLVAIAEGYCKDCNEYLCTQCYKTHRRNKMLANHVLLDKDSMPITVGSRKGVLDICEQKCTIHSDKVIEFFCDTCGKLECHVCVTLDHRQCGKVKHIPDIAKDLKNSSEFTAFQECNKSATDKLSEFEQNIQVNAASNNKMQTLAKQELQRQRAEINKFFDELEEQMDNEIITLGKRNEDTLKKASKKMQPMKKHLNQIKNEIEEKKAGQNCDLFIAMKKSKEKMRTYDDQFNAIQGELTIQHYTLIPSERIQAMMRNITEICKISTSGTNTEMSRTPAAETTIQLSRTPTARLESVTDIKTSKDKTEPYIRSFTIMHGHFCVVADRDNKSIKVVDTKGKKVTSEIGIEAKFIWSVTSVSDDQVVLSVILLDGKKQIQFFSVSTSGVIQCTNQQYYVEGFYLDMVHCKDNIYGVLRGKIDILSMTGKIIRTIKTNDKGAKQLVDMNQIALSPDELTLYVTISNKKSVTSLTLDGKVKAVYTDKDLKYPWGITVDKHGYVYVRSCGSSNIQQLTADLNKVKVLIEHVQGYRITYSRTENKLYIDDKNKINEYSLDFK